MRRVRSGREFWLFTVMCAASLPTCMAQQSAPFPTSPTSKSDTAAIPDTPKPQETHRFWDRKNILLFSGVALFRGLRPRVAAFDRPSVLGKQSTDRNAVGGWRSRCRHQERRDGLRGPVYLVPPGLVSVAVDDTLCHKRGKRVAFGGIFLDPVLSTRSRKILRFGLNYVVVAVVVHLPFRPDRYFALPVLWRVFRKKGQEGHYKRRRS